jgi:hypothetical protein
MGGHNYSAPSVDNFRIMRQNKKREEEEKAYAVRAPLARRREGLCVFMLQASPSRPARTLLADRRRSTTQLPHAGGSVGLSWRTLNVRARSPRVPCVVRSHQVAVESCP